MASLGMDVESSSRKTDTIFITTFSQGGRNLFRVTADKDTGVQHIEPLVKFVPLEGQDEE